MCLKLKMLVSLILVHFLFVVPLHGFNKIIDDRNCSEINHSFMVAIFLHHPDKSSFLGGGTLLSENWILTVGVHFFTDPRDRFYEAVAGAEHFSEISSKETYLQRSRFTEIHRTNDQIKRALDIAVLKLKQPMHLSRRVSFVRWSKITDIGENHLEDICKNATIIGYSNAESGYKEQDDRSLRCSQVSMLPKKLCKKKFPTTFIPHEAGCIYGKKDACYGDAGGPVMCNGIQFGVLTYRYKCGGSVPSLFTKVYEYQKFILKVMNKDFDPDLLQYRSSSDNNFNNYLLNFFVLVFITAIL